MPSPRSTCPSLFSRGLGADVTSGGSALQQPAWQQAAVWEPLHPASFHPWQQQAPSTACAGAATLQARTPGAGGAVVTEGDGEAGWRLAAHALWAAVQACGLGPLPPGPGPEASARALLRLLLGAAPEGEEEGQPAVCGGTWGAASGLTRSSGASIAHGGAAAAGPSAAAPWPVQRAALRSLVSWVGACVREDGSDRPHSCGLPAWAVPVGSDREGQQQEEEGGGHGLYLEQHPYAGGAGHGHDEDHASSQGLRPGLLAMLQHALRVRMEALMRAPPPPNRAAAAAAAGGPSRAAAGGAGGGAVEEGPAVEVLSELAGCSLALLQLSAHFAAQAQQGGSAGRGVGPRPAPGLAGLLQQQAQADAAMVATLGQLLSLAVHGQDLHHRQQQDHHRHQELHQATRGHHTAWWAQPRARMHIISTFMHVLLSAPEQGVAIVDASVFATAQQRQGVAAANGCNCDLCAAVRQLGTAVEQASVHGPGERAQPGRDHLCAMAAALALLRVHASLAASEAQPPGDGGANAQGQQHTAGGGGGAGGGPGSAGQQRGAPGDPQEQAQQQQQAAAQAKPAPAAPAPGPSSTSQFFVKTNPRRCVRL